MIITVSLGKHPLPHFGFFHHVPQLQPFPAPTLNPIPPLAFPMCPLYMFFDELCCMKKSYQKSTYCMI